MYANTELIAHIDEFGNTQTVREHLLGTAERAKQFAEEFGCGDIGFFTGLYHDIGKCSEEFQTRIRNPALPNCRSCRGSKIGEKVFAYVNGYCWAS